MRPFRILAVFLIGAALLVPSEKGHAQATVNGDSVYSVLSKRLRAGDTAIDLVALRLAYAHSRWYDPMSSSTTALRQGVMSAMASGDVKSAAARADSLLARNYADINAHVMAASFAKQAGDDANARHHGAVARALVRSWDLEHRGGSASTPILLIDPDEENVYGMVTGLERTSTYKTAQCGQRVCDSTVYHNPRSGRDTTIVFDISAIAEKAMGWKP